MRATAIAALITVAVLAAGTSGEAASNNDITRQAVFCQGTYALCIRALCTPDPSGGSTVQCGCVVEQGWSMGPGNCASRQPVTKDGVTTMISAYSNAFENADKTLTCANKDTKWANCYGAQCTVDSHDPKAVVCKCPVQTGAMSTLGGSCDHDNCSKIWSAAGPAAYRVVGNYFYHYMKRHHPNYPTNPPAEACFKKAS
jgi:hypothetical protein